uniref:Uncharacterized protein n=1 Tax=Glossina pallidipes TaxID=7398 RepID=A0A1B0A1E0_GLOPL
MGSETEINGYDEIPYGVASSQPIDINVYNSNLPLSSNGVCVNNNGDDHSAISSSPVTAVTETDCVSYVPVCINENDVIEGAKQILTAIRSHWDLKFVQFKEFNAIIVFIDELTQMPIPKNISPDFMVSNYRCSEL